MRPGISDSIASKLQGKIMPLGWKPCKDTKTVDGLATLYCIAEESTPGRATNPYRTISLSPFSLPSFAWEVDFVLLSYLGGPSFCIGL